MKVGKAHTHTHTQTLTWGGGSCDQIYEQELINYNSFVGNPSRSTGLPACTFANIDDSAPALSSTDRGFYFLTQSQTSYHSASMIPSIRLSPSCFDDANRDANVYARVAVIDLDNDNDNDDFVARDTLIEILGPSSTATPAIDLDGAFGDLGLTYNSDHTPFLGQFYLHHPLLLPLYLLESPPEIKDSFLSHQKNTLVRQ